MTPITYMQDLVKHLLIKIKIIFDKGVARFANNAINSCLFYPTLEISAEFPTWCEHAYWQAGLLSKVLSR